MNSLVQLLRLLWDSFSLLDLWQQGRDEGGGSRGRFWPGWEKGDVTWLCLVAWHGFDAASPSLLPLLSSPFHVSTSAAGL